LTLLYADTSAILRAYLVDEPDHEVLRSTLLHGTEPVVVSEVARIELASAMARVGRSGRLPNWKSVLEQIDNDFGDAGPIALVAIRAETVFPAARRLAVESGLRAMDAVHLAVATEECPAIAAGDDVVFITRDREQANAAAALGLVVL